MGAPMAVLPSRARAGTARSFHGWTDYHLVLRMQNTDVRHRNSLHCEALAPRRSIPTGVRRFQLQPSRAQTGAFPERAADSLSPCQTRDVGNHPSAIHAGSAQPDYRPEKAADRPVIHGSPTRSIGNPRPFEQGAQSRSGSGYSA